MKEVFLNITGRVQRVGYRRWAQKIARNIGEISGWVRNVEDGSVEILMRGPNSRIEEMIAACSQGPWLAKVDAISVKSIEGNHFLPPVENGVFERL